MFTAVFVVFVFWGMLGRLDIVAMTRGEVIPSTQVKTIQHLEGGIVSKIAVHEGQKVKKGQPLVYLEKVISGADLSELKVRTTSLAIRIRRLEAEAAGLDQPAFSEDMITKHPDIVKDEMEQFATWRKDFQSRIAAQNEAIAQKEFDISQAKDRLKNLQKALDLQMEKVRISEKLLEKDLTNRYLHLDLLSKVNDLKGSILETKTNLSSANAALNEAKAQLQQIKTSTLSDVQNDLNEQRNTLRELSQRLIKFEDSVSRTVVRSTLDGTIKTLYVVTEGGVVKPGEPIVDLVPEGDRLIVEAKLQTGDIGYVRPGQDVSIKLASSDASRFKAIDGKVASISPDTLMTKDGKPYYRVRIDADQTYFQGVGTSVEYQLYPGMQVIANIKTGTRTVLQYLFGPVVYSFDSAMQER